MIIQKYIVCIIIAVLQVIPGMVRAQDLAKLNALRAETDIQKQINILFSITDDKESLKTIDQAIKQDPSNPSFYYLRGILNNGREKYSKALNDFSNAIDMGAGSLLLYRCYLGRGVSYMKLMEFENAMADLNSSIEKNDTLAVAYYSRAMIHYELKDYEASVQDFQKILRFTEGNGEFYFNLGMAYYRLEDKEQACRNLNKACTLGNTNACRMSLMECAKAIPTLP